MNANDVIEAYVTDIAARLPRALRNDVALELRALLVEELHARAESAGHAADEALALGLVRAFGRPADVAARYRPTLTIIDPSDGPSFLRATVIGLAIIWGTGLFAQLRQPFDPGWDVLLPLSRWWLGTVLPSLWWPGVLVLGYGLAARSRRRQSPSSDWTPRGAEGAAGAQSGWVLGVIGILFGLSVLIDPRWWLESLFGDRLAPVAYDALTYTEAFRQRQAPWLLALLALMLPAMVASNVSGRASALLRRLQTGLSLVLCAVLAWTLAEGPVMLAPAGDRAAKSLLAVIVVVTLASLAVGWFRRVRPAANRRPVI